MLMLELKEFTQKRGVNDKLLVYCLSVGLRTINEEDEDFREELMEKFNINEESLEEMISELDELSWNV